jgi:putative acetyltransferase
MKPPSHPVLDPSRVGTYPASVKSGGGFVWDAVLEYRVWCHPERGAPDLEEGSDYFYAFETLEEALEFSQKTPGAEEPLALIVQEEYISEPEPGTYLHVKARRVTEWPVAFLSRPRRTARTIPDFLAPDAPPNRLDILRGLA